MFRKSLATAAVLALAASSQAALDYTGGTSVISFDQNVGFATTATPTSVFKAGSGVNQDAVHISEPNEWYWGGDMSKDSFSSHSWDFVDNLPTVAAPFSADFNNNGATDSRRDLFQMATFQFGGGKAIKFTEDTWQDKRLTLQILNNTGSTLTGLSFSADTWFNDTNKNVATLSLRWGTSYDGTALPNILGSRTGTKANSGLSGMETIGGQASFSIPTGSYVYLQLDYDQNGNGTEFIVDNLTIGAVPEPATLGLLGTAGLLMLRRRK